MSSDSHNSTMAKTTGLIFLLFDVASAREVPFAIPLYIQCVLHGLSMALLCVPFIFVHHKVSIHWYARDGFHIVATLIATILFKQLLIRTAA